MKCKDCKHSERWQCNTKTIWYCGLLHSNRTHNHKLKIKANQEQCKYIEEKFEYENRIYKR